MPINWPLKAIGWHLSINILFTISNAILISILWCMKVRKFNLNHSPFNEPMGGAHIPGCEFLIFFDYFATRSSQDGVLCGHTKGISTRTPTHTRQDFQQSPNAQWLSAIKRFTIQVTTLFHFPEFAVRCSPLALGGCDDLYHNNACNEWISWIFLVP